MDATIFKSILESWWASLAVIVWWWYLVIKYFMKTMEAKDIANQENLDRFIELIEKPNPNFLSDLSKEWIEHYIQSQSIVNNKKDGL